jgi:hypothetical protein
VELDLRKFPPTPEQFQFINAALNKLKSERFSFTHKKRATVAGAGGESVASLA